MDKGILLFLVLGILKCTLAQRQQYYGGIIGNGITPTKGSPTEATPPSKDAKVKILKQLNKVNDDGSYTFGYEADDGSFKVETRDKDGIVKGKYGFVDASGKLKTVEYSAGEKNGFNVSPDLTTAAQTGPKARQAIKSSTPSSRLTQATSAQSDSGEDDGGNSVYAQISRENSPGAGGPLFQGVRRYPGINEDAEIYPGSLYGGVQEGQGQSESPRFVPTSLGGQARPIYPGGVQIGSRGQGGGAGSPFLGAAPGGPGRQGFPQGFPGAGNPQQTILGGGAFRGFDDDPRFSQFGPGGAGGPGGRQGQYVPSVELDGFSEDADEDGFVDQPRSAGGRPSVRQGSSGEAPNAEERQFGGSPFGGGLFGGGRPGQQQFGGGRGFGQQGRQLFPGSGGGNDENQFQSLYPQPQPQQQQGVSQFSGFPGAQGGSQGQSQFGGQPGFPGQFGGQGGFPGQFGGASGRPGFPGGSPFGFNPQQQQISGQQAIGGQGQGGFPGHGGFQGGFNPFFGPQSGQAGQNPYFGGQGQSQQLSPQSQQFPGAQSPFGAGPSPYAGQGFQGQQAGQQYPFFPGQFQGGPSAQFPGGASQFSQGQPQSQGSEQSAGFPYQFSPFGGLGGGFGGGQQYPGGGSPFFGGSPFGQQQIQAGPQQVIGGPGGAGGSLPVRLQAQQGRESSSEATNSS